MDGVENRRQEVDSRSVSSLEEAGSGSQSAGHESLVAGAQGDREVSAGARAGDANIWLVARDPSELAGAHAQMLAWCEQEITVAKAEKTGEEANLHIAQDKHWSTAPFKRRIRQLEQRVQFLEKVYAAVEAGYVIIPNFAMNVFAIRTERWEPTGAVDSTTWQRRGQKFVEPSKALPAGVGDYVNPLVDATHTSEKVGDKTHHIYESVDTFSDVNYPITIAKPVLMQRTAQAMALKVFDEIGVATDTVRGRSGTRGDPVLIGRILNPNPNKPALSVFLGWYFDPSVL
jgi:hypothetical protein